MLYNRRFSNFTPEIEFITCLKVAVKLTMCAVPGICALITSVAVASGLPEASPQTPPDLQVQVSDMDGRPVTLADYEGSPLLVNFWASWCTPCVAELPALERAVASLGTQSIKVLLVSVDRGGARKALPFLKKYKVSSPELAFDPKGILSRQLAVRGLPTTFLLSADQTKLWTFVGPYEWDMEPVQQDIREFLSPVMQ